MDGFQENEQENSALSGGELKEPETQVFSCPMSYLLNAPFGQVGANGEGDVALFKTYLVVSAKNGAAFQVGYRDIIEAFAADYRVRMPLTSGETLEIYYLGYQYEAFCRNLFLLRNELLIWDLLMNEAAKFHGVRGEYKWICDGNNSGSGPSEIRVYETAVVVMPEIGEPLRVPFAEVDSVNTENYALQITTEEDSTLTLSMLGRAFDPLNLNISQAINALDARTQSCLKEMVPQIDPASLRRLAGYMREGRAVRRMDVDAIASKLWETLENSVKSRGNMEGYECLSALSQKSRICMGVKRGLMGDMTGDYVWFLFPIYGADPLQPGNVVAMEALSGEGASMATYFFRVMSRQSYAAGKSLEEIDQAVDRFLKTINRCLLAINFRREPIYLSDVQLNEPRFIRYRTALQKIPAMTVLREHYIGRVIHSTIDQWKKDVIDLLAFNVQSNDDKERWLRK